MKRMKIGCIVIGIELSYTPEERKNVDLNLQKSDNLRTKIDSTIVSKACEAVKKAIPENCDFFCAHASSENDAIDLPDADVYVAVPFAASDIVYSVLYSKNKPVVISVPPYKDIWSYGAVFFPYFVRDVRKIDEILGLKNQVFVSKNTENLRAILEALLVKYRINHTTALCIGEVMYEPYHSWNWGYEMIRAIQEKFGIRFRHISSEKFLKTFENWSGEFDEGTLLKEINNNRLNAEQNIGNVEKMYHIFKQLIRENEADIFTVNCLYSVIHTGCKATACYALSKLNDEGIVATCEADITTMINMLIVSCVSGSPAFMLNPYLFPEDNVLFASHCTSPRKHSFSDTALDDINIYPYFEMPEFPCGMQIIKKAGPVTVTGLSHDKMDEMIIIRGNIIRNTTFPSCRTQIELSIEGDIKEVSELYQGRHWALIYGDYSKKLELTNKILGINSKIF